MCVPQSLWAGAAQVEITPQGDVHLAGAVGEFRPAQRILDPLYAKALLLESGNVRLLIVALDLAIIAEEWTERIRRAVANQFGFPAAHVLVYVTQTHTAPSLGHFMVDENFGGIPRELEWLRGGDPRYFEFAFDRILHAVRQAVDSVQPVRVRIGSGIEGRLAFNRRAVTNDGKVRMPGPRWEGPLGPTYLRYLEGPIDPEVGVICLQADDLRPVAMLLHYTCHPVNIFPKPVVSADWPGAWAEEVRRRVGSSCVPVVLNGCCGDINPWDPFDPAYVPDHVRMGKMLADTTEKILDNSSYETDSMIDARVRRVLLPFREVDTALQEEAQRILTAHPTPAFAQDNPRRVDPNWVKAASIMSIELSRRRRPALDYEITVFRLGRAALVGLPGEPFVEGQLRIKMASAAYRTYIAHCASHYAGYLPTREAFARGGHEVETRFWAKLTPDALDVVVETTVQLIEELFGKKCA